MKHTLFVAVMLLLAGCWPTVNQSELVKQAPPPGTMPTFDLQAKPISSTDVSLVWDSVPSATGYLVEISYDGKVFHDSVQVAASPTSAIPQQLDPGTKYYFRVTAIGSKGNLAVSKLVTATTPIATTSNAGTQP